MKRFTRRTNTGRFNIAADRAARLARASAAGMISEALEARLFLSATPKAAIGTPAAGYGLLAQYYPSSDFSGTPIDRIDRSVNFAWGRGTPTRSIPRGAFSAKWTGDVIAPRTGTFTFALTSLGGAHLIINGTDVVNDMGASGAKPTTDTGTVDLVAGQSYSLELDYVANGRSSVSLKFAPPKGAKQVIPARSLLSGVTPPPAPSNLSAQVASSNEVDLSWQANGSSLTGFTVQRATGKGPFVTVANVGGTVSGYQDTRVRANTTYSYRVIAANVAGKSSASSPLVVKTVPAGTTPIDTSAVVSGGNAVFVSWALPPSASNLTSFSIDRSTDGSNTWTNVGSVDVNTNVFTDSTAVDGHSYIYRITAMSGSTAAPFIGTTSVNVPLAAPSGLTAALSGATTVLLQWTNNSTSATGFEIDRSPNGGVTWATLANVPAGTTSYSTTIAPGQSYAYQVRATMGANTTSSYSNLAAVAAQLGAPSNLTATANSSTSVTVRWTVNSSGQTGFEIDRSTDGGATWPTVFYAPANAGSYTDTTALGAATYTYRVRAQAGATNSGYAPAATVSTDLAAPGNVTATALTTTGVLISWADTNLNATGYEVDRSPDGSSSWTPLTTTAANVTSYTDTGLSATTTYYYRVTALGPNATTAPSPVVAATTASSDSPQLLLTPSTLSTLEAKVQSNTPQWQAFKTQLDQNLTQIVSYGAYQGSDLSWIEQYALGYQLLKDSDPTTAAAYADKAIALITSGLQNFEKGDWGTRQFLAVGDGSTTTFTLPNQGVLPASLRVYLSPVTVVPVVRSTTSAQDSVGYYYDFLSVSNTQGGSPNYTQGTDWNHNPNIEQDVIDWSNAANAPAPGSTYYVTVTTGFGATNTSYTLSSDGSTVTLSQAPAANQAVLVEYVYNQPGGLLYQQTSANDGGFNSIMIDDTYPSRNLGQYLAIGYDWLYDYAGFSPQLRTATANMLVKWFDYETQNGYYGNYPTSNYGAGGYVSDMFTAVALSGSRDSNGTRLVTAMTAYHANNVVPALTGPAPSEAGGFWAEGWSYGTLAATNILLAGVAFQDAGLGSDAAEQQWAPQVIDSIIEAQPTQSTVYDGGDWFAYPAPVPSGDLFAVLASVTPDPQTAAYANYILQNYPNETFVDGTDFLFRDPTAPAQFWSNLPLSQHATGTGLITARADWSYNSTWLSFQVGNAVAADHQSFSPGELELQRGADGLLINANALGDNQTGAFKSTYANIVAINDPNNDGLQTYAWSMGYWYGNPGVAITAYDTGAGFMYAAGDYGRAYSSNLAPDGGGPVTQLTRQVFYLRPDTVVVYDRATTVSANDAKQLQWHFLNAPALTGNNGWVESVGNSKLFGQTYSDVPLSTTVATVQVNNAAVQRLAVNPVTQTASVQYVSVLESTSSGAGSPPEPTAHVESSDGQLEGTQVGSSVVLFGRNGSVSGGSSYSFTAGAGQSITHYLTDMTPGQTYTLSGADQGSATADAQGVVTFTTTGTGAAQTVTLS